MQSVECPELLCFGWVGGGGWGGGRGEKRGGGEGGWGCGQPTAHGTALPTAISPNWCTCTLNVQKFGFANLGHDDFFLLNLCCYHYKISSSVQCSAA